MTLHIFVFENLVFSSGMILDVGLPFVYQNPEPYPDTFAINMQTKETNNFTEQILWRKHRLINGWRPKDKTSTPQAQSSFFN